MKKQLTYAGLFFLAIAVFGFRGTFLSHPEAVLASGADHAVSASVAPAASTTVGLAASAKSAAAPDDDLGPPGLDAKVQQWIAALSAKAPYTTWAKAERTVSPLGPGTHSWLITLQLDGKAAGYLIVSANPSGDGYSLEEYGTGEQPLYSMNTLYQSMVRHEIIDPHMSYEAFVQDQATIKKTPLYLGPLNTFWQIKIRNDTLYFDAKSGELLPPINVETFSAQDASSAAEAHKSSRMKTLTKTAASPAFDPLADLTWAKKDASTIATKAELIKGIDRQQKLTYTAKLRGGMLTYPLAVTGYDVWNDGTSFIKLDQLGNRTVSYEALASVGRFTL